MWVCGQGPFQVGRVQAERQVRGQRGSMSVISYFPFWLLSLAFLHVPIDGSLVSLCLVIELHCATKVHANLLGK